ARGGVVIFGGDTVQTVALTDSIRDGARSFQIEMPGAVVAVAQGDVSAFLGTAAARIATPPEATSVSSGSVPAAVVTLVAQALVTSVPSDVDAQIGGPESKNNNWVDDWFYVELPPLPAPAPNGNVGPGRGARPAAADGPSAAALASIVLAWM